MTLAFWGILVLLQKLWKIVSLKLKLSSSPLYLLSFIYIFIRFVNSLPRPWLNKVGCINKTGCRVGEVKVGVSMVLVLVSVLIILVLVLMLLKLFLRR